MCPQADNWLIDPDADNYAKGFSAVLNEEAPSLDHSLFHYTTEAGLDGIRVSVGENSLMWRRPSRSGDREGRGGWGDARGTTRAMLRGARHDVGRPGSTKAAQLWLAQGLGGLDIGGSVGAVWAGRRSITVAAS